MKIFFGLLAIVLCFLMGYKFSEKYVQRRKFFCGFNTFNKKIKNEISFSQNTILSLLSSCEDKNNLFTLQLNKYFVKKEPVNLDKHIFSEEERVFFENYLNVLGKSDKSTQINFITKIEIEISDLVKKSIEEEKKVKNLSLKISFLTALIIFILIL